MFLNWFHAKKIKNEVVGSLANPKSSARWLEPQSWHTFNEDGKEGGRYGSLSLEVEYDSLEKVMKTLTPKMEYMGFPIGLKWLKPTKGLSHLIYSSKCVLID